MRNPIRFLILFLAACALLTVCALASAEPGADVPDRASVNTSFEVTFVINGTTVRSASVSYRAEGNVYTFSLKDLMDAVGMKVSFDEKTRVLSVAPQTSGLMQDVLERSLSDRGKTDDAAETTASSQRSILSNRPARGLMADVLARSRDAGKTTAPARGLMADVLAHSRRAAADVAEAVTPLHTARETLLPATVTPAEIRERPIGSFFRTRSIA